MATATVAAAPPVASQSNAALMEFAVDRNQFLTEGNELGARPGIFGLTGLRPSICCFYHSTSTYPSHERPLQVGLGTGMKAYHTFLLVKTDLGCHIITEEVVRGEGAIKFRQEQPNAMHDGHDLWLPGAI
jgi:hypothetical protein